MSEIRVRFKGDPNKQEHYSGDGFEMNVGDVEQMTVAQAHQKITDHPTWFELVDIDSGFLHELFLQEQGAIAAASSKKGIRIIDEYGNETRHPAGSEITIRHPVAPQQKPKSNDSKPVRKQCGTEGCSKFIKADESHCKKHAEKKAKNLKT